MTSQKDIFLASEGDAWFRRNQNALQTKDWTVDPVCRRITSLPRSERLKVLEIGCGDGSRLAHLARTANIEPYGIDPSLEAVSKAKASGVNASQSTAERLAFPDGFFNIVLFGFCLYLCDDRDLFRICFEADRVLADPGWLLILDFESRAPSYRTYHHLPGIRSRKMDYKSMFLWHPSYTLASQEKFHHSNGTWTDDADEWVTLACLRKRGQ